MPREVLQRPRLVERLERSSRVGLIIAPAGYGKTILARQWVMATERTAAWLTLDFLDATPIIFWQDLIRAMRSVFSEVDGTAERVLLEGADVRQFLPVLLAQIERSNSEGATLVLDDLTQLTDRDLLDGVALVVDHVGERLRLLITARSDLLLPIARWRAAGWVAEVSVDDLRFRDDEALAVAAAFDNAGLSTNTIVALNRHVEGWPLAFHLALVAAQDSSDPERDAFAFTRSDRHFADHLVGEILDRLSPGGRDVVLALSVVDWFDPEMARELAGADAGTIVVDLLRRRLLVSSIDVRPDALRFHSLLRQLLEAELRWRDPGRHAELHRSAAELSTRRGDLTAAHRHLVAAGDQDVATDPILGSTLRSSGLLAGLTPREETILELLPSYLSYAQIGEHLHVSVNTVKSNLQSVYRKLGVSTRAAAVEVARIIGLL